MRGGRSIGGGVERGRKTVAGEQVLGDGRRLRAPTTAGSGGGWYSPRSIRPDKRTTSARAKRRMETVREKRGMAGIVRRTNCNCYFGRSESG